MLPTRTEFPHAGCAAFLAGTTGAALPVTVLRHNADATALVRFEPDPPHTHASDRDLRGATGNSTVPFGDLHETREAAAAAALATVTGGAGGQSRESRKAKRAKGRRVPA